MNSGGNGVKTAVDLVTAGMAAAPDHEPEQIDIEDYLGLPPRDGNPTGGAVAGADGARARGRPAGARNKRTQQWADYLLSRYASPLEVLAQIAVARIEDLKLQLNCNALEAMQEKRHAAIALAPFLHQRQPLALNVTERKVIYLTIQADSSPPANIEPDTVTLTATILSDQRVSKLEAPSLGTPSLGTDGANALEHKDNAAIAPRIDDPKAR